MGACFIPWVHYNGPDLTFTGFKVERFSNGNYYGRAGLAITILTVLILSLMLLPRIWAKRVNVFLGALLVAYCIRTFIIFTSSMFSGEVEKLAGIYLIIILSPIILISTLFPGNVKMPGKQ